MRRALLSFSPNGTWLAMSAKERTINIYFASDGRLFKTLKAGPLPQSEKEGIGAFASIVRTNKNGRFTRT